MVLHALDHDLGFSANLGIFLFFFSEFIQLTIYSDTLFFRGYSDTLLDNESNVYFGYILLCLMVGTSEVFCQLIDDIIRLRIGIMMFAFLTYWLKFYKQDMFYYGLKKYLVDLIAKYERN